MNLIACPDREQLAAYVLGTLPEDEADALSEHLAACSQCSGTIEALDGLNDTLIAALRAPAPSGSEGEYVAEPEFLRALASLRRVLSGVGSDDVGATPSLEAGQGQGPSEPEARRPERATTASTLPGTLGEYELLSKLGQGGMGAVYKARQTRLDKVVAIKLLPRERLNDPRARARFDREMLAVGRLNHPNIVGAHDAREIDGQPLLVMEFVEGLDFGALVDRCGPLPVAEACELIRQTALGLHYAHETGLVHRDIKPSNLILATDPIVKILDFGLALLHAGRPTADESTGAGLAMGTPDYMAPEQVRDVHQVDIRADVYSLGCTLYKLLAGQPPFSGPRYQSTFDKMLGHAHDPHPPIRSVRPDVPEPLAAVLDRMLAKSPADRYPTPGEVAAALAPFAAGHDLSALLARALESSAAARAVAPTDPLASSAMAGTQPPPNRRGAGDERSGLPSPARGRGAGGEGGREPQAVPSPVRWWPTDRRKQIALGVAFFLVLLGIVITIEIRKNRVRVSIEPDPPVAPGNAPKDLAEPSEGSTEGRRPIRLSNGMIRLWQTDLTQSGPNGIMRVKLTPDGNHLIVFHCTATPLARLEKLDAQNGAVVWQRTISLPHRATFGGWVDAAGDIYVTTGWGGHELWKYDAEARTPIWRFRGGPGFEYVGSPITDAARNVYAAGHRGSGIGGGSECVKLNIAGTKQWNKLCKHTAGGDAYSAAMALDVEGNVYRVGTDGFDPVGSTQAAMRGRLIGHRKADLEVMADLPMKESNSSATGVLTDARGDVYVAYMHGLSTPEGRPTNRERAVVLKLDGKRLRASDVQSKPIWEYRFKEEGINLPGNSLVWNTENRFFLGYQEKQRREIRPAIAELNQDGNLLWKTTIDLPGWTIATGGMDAANGVVFLGLMNADDEGQAKLLALDVRGMRDP